MSLAISKKETRKLVWKDFILRVVLPSLIAIFLYIFAVYVFIIPAIEKHTIDQKCETLKELTYSAWSILENYHNKELSGIISKEKAQQGALAEIRNIRYGKERKDYFWINDMHPNMIMHPYNTHLNGTDLSNYEDYKGKKLFVEIVNTLKTKEEGFVSYMWQWKDDSSKIVKKLSFVKRFTPWGWALGTGIYLDDVKQKVESIESRVLVLSGVIIIIIALMLFIIIMYNIKTVKNKFQIEQKLRQNEQRFKILSESTFEAIFIIQNGIIIDVNNSALELTQRTFSDLFGSSPLEFIDKRYKQEAYNHIINHKDKIFESVGVRKDGSKIDIEIRTKIIDFGGEVYRISAVRDITEKKLAAKRLVESQNNLFYKILEAEEKERVRISTDLHDGIGPDLISLKHHLNALENAETQDQSNIIIKKSYNIIEQSIINLKRISKALSPYLLKDFGLNAAIKNFIEDVKISNIQVHYESNIGKQRFTTEIEISLFRIVKELINNSLKHSDADTLCFNISLKNKLFHLNYVDNGKGFNVEETLNPKIPNSSFGLKNIMSRVKSMNGSIEIVSSIGSGIYIDIHIPHNNIKHQ